MDALSFDVRWQHALDVTMEDAYLSRRSLVEFRRRLVLHDRDGSLLREVFDGICAAGIRELGLNASEQRLDSTLIMSDIRAHGRLSLARETLRVFVHSLDDEQRTRLPEAVVSWYEDRRSGQWQRQEDDKERKKRLHEIGVLVHLTLDAFSDDEVVSEAPSYALLRRLADEHAEALGLAHEDADIPPDNSAADSGTKPQPEAPKRTDSKGKGKKGKRQKRTKQRKAHYWSPHDPNASFGHKGLGYHVHISETCRNEGTELLTDYELLTAAQSDVGQSTPVLERLRDRGLTPSVLYADGGYPTPAELVKSNQQGIELCAPVNRGRLPEESFSRVDFQVDSTNHHATCCPAGHAPVRHGERDSSDSTHPRRALYAFFAAATCDACAHRCRCPVCQPNNRRSHEYRLELSDEMLARDARWVEQHGEPFRKRYRIRSGVEAAMSELKRGLEYEGTPAYRYKLCSRPPPATSSGGCGPLRPRHAPY